jgi:hypothetical protein
MEVMEKSKRHLPTSIWWEEMMLAFREILILLNTISRWHIKMEE